MPPLSEADPEIRNSPVIWFAILEAARKRHDFQTAADAQRELDRLGVRVTYRRKPRQEAVIGK